MKYFTFLKSFLLIAALTVGIVQAQVVRGVDSIYVTQDFKVGSTYNYDVQRGKSDSRKPGSEDIKSSTAITFKVLSLQDNLRKCSWKYGKTIILRKGEKMDLPSQESELYEGLNVMFTINNGAMVELDNYEECRKFMDNAVTLMLKSASSKSTDDESRNIIEAMKASYDTPEKLVQTYCPEITVFFQLFGETINADSVTVYATEVVNPLGGPNFPGVNAIQLDTIMNNVATISVHQIISKEDLNAVITETFKELSKKMGKPFSPSDIPDFNTEAVTRYQFNIAKQILKDVMVEKTITTGNIRQMQTIKVSLKD